MTARQNAITPYWGDTTLKPLQATVPERHAGNLWVGMHRIGVPLPIPEFTVSLLWYPRMDGDPAHRWLRESVRDACASQFEDPLAADVAA